MSKKLKEGGTKCAFGPEDLEVLDVAYQSALARLMLRDPKNAETAKVFLRHKVIQIAKCGVRDPETLSGLALDMLQKERQARPPSVMRRSSALPKRILQA